MMMKLFNLFLIVLYFRKISTQCIRDASSNCVVYDNIHIKTYDGGVYSFDSSCSYTLVSIPAVNLEINYLKNPTGLQIKYAGRTFLTSISDKGVITFTRDGVQQPFPETYNSVTVSKPGRMFIAEIKTLGIKIRYDGNTIEIIQENDDNLLTNGVCGNNDGCSNNDLVMKNGEITTSSLKWVDSWALNSCTATSYPNACGTNSRLQVQAQNYCTNLFARTEFAACSNYSSPLINVCISNYCGCKLTNRYDCMCDMLDSIVRTCQMKKDNLISWRSSGLCPIQCANIDQSFSTCAPNRRQLSCGEEEIANPLLYDCEEGCYCPAGMRLFDGKCLFVEECPCSYNDVFIPPGSSIAQECNTCICRKGTWDCTNKVCVEEGGCIGDPHYVTFDGRKYDFMGKCSYYVVRGIGFDVICDHYIWNSLGFVKDFTSKGPSYCAKVIVVVQDDTIEIAQNQVVTVNDRRISSLPHKVSNIRITKPSSQFTNVVLPNYVTVSFDGRYTVSVKIPTTMKNRVRGLFGTYNKNKADDFLMPDGTLATNANTFGHSWKVPGSCENEFTGEVPHPCDANPNKRPGAEEACSFIKGSLFAGCSDDPDADYADCIYDGCNCADNDEQCLCSMYAKQGAKCAAKGINVDWRSTITQCALQCPAGQTYQTCGNSCTRSCADISMNPVCFSECVDGCNCPEGQALNNKNQCVQIEQCPCVYDGVQFPPAFAFVDIEEGNKHVCLNAKWTIIPATPEDINDYPSLTDFHNQCNRDNFLVYSGCKRTNTLTCLNKHLEEPADYDACTAGCECAEGFVMDSELGMCVRPEDCPCMYKGISYPDNAVVDNRDENWYKRIVTGFWECTPQTDNWQKCSVWGDVHVRTFDEIVFSFEGYCEYTLFEHVFGTGVFRVTLETGSCNTGSCIAAVYIHFRSQDGHVDNIIFNTGRDYIWSPNLQHLIVSNFDVSVMVDVVSLGVRVIWNKEGWVHIHASRAWLTWNHFGLCGKYDNDGSNDLEIPGGASTGVVDFVNYNRLDRACGGSSIISKIDMLHPNDPCNYLFSDVFKVCRYLVDVTKYYETCIINAQKQLELPPAHRTNHYCEPIAAYAQECNDARVSVNWRSAELCPVQCPANTVYYSCDNPCPKETCANSDGFEDLCPDKVCAEACNVPICPAGQVYWNGTYTLCVLREQCPPAVAGV